MDDSFPIHPTRGQLFQWHFVNGYMQNDSFREYVQRVAWVHRPNASKALKQKVDNILIRTIKVRGFRQNPNLLTLAFTTVKTELNKSMWTNADTSAAILALWAEAEEELIRNLQKYLRKNGVALPPTWDWQAGMCGYYDMDHIADLIALVENYTAGQDERFHWQNLLGCLWLSAGLELEGATALIHYEEAFPDEVEDSLEAAPEINLSTLYDSFEQSLEKLKIEREALRQKQTDYQSLEERISQDFEASLPALRKKLEERPDLESNLESLVVKEKLKGHDLAAACLDILKQISDYDTERNRLLLGEQDLEEQIQTLQVQLGETLYHATEETTEEIDDSRRLNQLREKNSQLQLQVQQLSQRHQQRKQVLLEQILDLLELIPVNESNLDKLFRKELTEDNLGSKNIDELMPILVTLQEFYHQWQQSLQLSQTKSRKLSLSENFTAPELLDFFTALAQEGRDIELLLFLLVGYVSHNPSFDLDLPSPIVQSLLLGIEQLSPNEALLNFFNQLAPSLLNRWSSSEPLAQAKLQMMLIGADLGQERLAEGTAWLFPASHWPFANMPAWAKLWDSCLLGENYPISLDEQTLDFHLRECQNEVEQYLFKENGRYARVGALKSNRHSGVFVGHLFPELEHYYALYQQNKEKLLSCSKDELTWTWPKIETEIVETLGFFEADNLLERYETAVQEEKLRDTQPFLREKSLRLYHDAAGKIENYARSLLDLGQGKLRQRELVSLQQLQDELMYSSELKALGLRLIELLSSKAEKLKDSNKADGNQVKILAKERIVQQILSEPNLALRFPELVSAFVQGNLDERSDYAQWYAPLRRDILGQKSQSEAAEQLLRAEAANQVLLATKLNLELQLQARELQAQVSKEIAVLESEVLQLGGEVEDLKIHAKSTGRWGFLRKELLLRIDAFKAQLQSQAQGLQARLLALINEISQLELRVFKANISSETKQVIGRGLNLIKQAAMEDKELDGARAFIKDLQYRLEHEAWNVGEIQALGEGLENNLLGDKRGQQTALNAKEVLERFNRGDLRSLGFTENQLQLSNIDTRCHILENWLKIKACKHFYTAEMSLPERNAVSNFYRYFVRMVAMQQVVDYKGEHLKNEDISPYAIYQMSHPKTSALLDNCVLVTLPSERPKSQARQALDELISGKNWLPDWFVIIFIPGSTPEIKRAFEREYPNKGLLVIDEESLLSMILAESFGSKPIGRLRALLLNTRNLGFIDIFKTNQSVDVNKSIFVGRDYLIDQVTSSGDNYALYGGRRIGKSSAMNAIYERLQKKDMKVVFYSFEGRGTENQNAADLALGLKLPSLVHSVDGFRQAVENYLDVNPNERIALLLDEIDKYIYTNPTKHHLIEVLRSLSERYLNRFRVIVSGFMRLHDCMKLQGPYTASSDPWRRMFKEKLLGNLTAESAEAIVREGFIEILGWNFQHRSIPQGVVERTGGHPAFVQSFCDKLQHRVGERQTAEILLEDLKEVFEDNDPENSFIAFVHSTLEMNLNPVARFIIVWLAKTSEDLRSFRFEQLMEYADLLNCPQDFLRLSLDDLLATSVIKEIALGLYEFTVPDYPLILSRLGDTQNLDELEAIAKAYIVKWKQDGKSFTRH